MTDQWCLFVGDTFRQYRQFAVILKGYLLSGGQELIIGRAMNMLEREGLMHFVDVLDQQKGREQELGGAAQVFPAVHDRAK
jgi:hypothetical protein